MAKKINLERWKLEQQKRAAFPGEGWDVFVFGIWAFKPTDTVRIAKIKRCMHSMLSARESIQSGSRRRWSNEAQALEDATRPLRSCDVHVSKGSLKGVEGYFTRYSVDGKDVAVTFVKQYQRSRVLRFVDPSSRTRPISWKKLNNGEPLEFCAALWGHFLNRVAKGTSRANVLFHDISRLNPIAFHDSTEELSDQFGFWGPEQNPERV